MSNKKIFIPLIAVVLIIGIGFFMTLIRFNSGTTTEIPQDNVHIIEGQQIVTINAKGGYAPKITTAKSGIPTIIRFSTNGTFDCSASVRIPSLGVTKILPASGLTDIPVGTATSGTLQGTCGMGMYSFQINFQS